VRCRRIRAAGCDAILNLSTGTADGRSDRDARIQPLDRLRWPRSTAERSNFGERIFAGDLPFLRRMAEALKCSGARPEIECADTGHVDIDPEPFDLADGPALHEDRVNAGYDADSVERFWRVLARTQRVLIASKLVFLTISP
jgi:uncharacterized protein (DUF849 family)